MDATLTVMDLAGAIAVLIWGVHMVQTGETMFEGVHPLESGAFRHK